MESSAESAASHVEESASAATFGSSTPPVESSTAHVQKSFQDLMQQQAEVCNLMAAEHTRTVAALEAEILQLRTALAAAAEPAEEDDSKKLPMLLGAAHHSHVHGIQAVSSKESPPEHVASPTLSPSPSFSFRSSIKSPAEVPPGCIGGAEVANVENAMPEAAGDETCEQAGSITSGGSRDLQTDSLQPVRFGISDASASARQSLHSGSSRASSKSGFSSALCTFSAKTYASKLTPPPLRELQFVGIRDSGPPCSPESPARLEVWPVWKSVRSEDGQDHDSGFAFQLQHSRIASTELVRRLKHLDMMAQDYGNGCLTVAILQGLVLHPSCQKRIVWTVTSIILITYDLVVTPLSVFDLEDTVFTDSMLWITMLFWTIDFPLSFFVGYYNKSTLEMSIGRTAKHYLKTWMVLDLMLIAIDWTIVILGANLDTDSHGGARTLRLGKAMRTTRSLRSLRLLRLMKIPKMFHDTTCLIGRSEYVLLTFGIFKHVFVILFLNHLIACVWYFIGSRQGGWVSVYVKAEPVPMLYFTSLHWSVTQFSPATMAVQPENLGERIYSVVIALFALITFSSFVSSITNLMKHLWNLHSMEAKQFMRLERYLHERKISFHLSLRIRRYIEQVQSEHLRTLQEHEVDLLQKLSMPLQMELRYEVHFPIVSKHPFFRYYALHNAPVVQRLCSEALELICLCAGDSLFSVGDTAWAMYFVARGKLVYSQTQRVSPAATPGGASPASCAEPQTVVAGQWFCESVLWTPWNNRGNMNALTETSLLALDAAKAREILSKNKAAALPPAAYAAEAVDRLNRYERAELSDLDHCFLECERLARDVIFNTPSRRSSQHSSSESSSSATGFGALVVRSVKRVSVGGVRRVSGVP